MSQRNPIKASWLRNVCSISLLVVIDKVILVFSLNKSSYQEKKEFRNSLSTSGYTRAKGCSFYSLHDRWSKHLLLTWIPVSNVQKYRRTTSEFFFTFFSYNALYFFLFSCSLSQNYRCWLLINIASVMSAFLLKCLFYALRIIQYEWIVDKIFCFIYFWINFIYLISSLNINYLLDLSITYIFIEFSQWAFFLVVTILKKYAT